MKRGEHPTSSLPTEEELDALLGRAYARRKSLEETTDAYRLFHGWSEGVPGLEIDTWSRVITISAPRRLEKIAPQVIAWLEERVAPLCILTKFRGKDPEVSSGTLPNDIVASESCLRFAIEPLRRGNPGLYTDARSARIWISENSAGKTILNLFAFTGSLGLAASAGGARSVCHVDSQRTSLDRARRNYELNNLAIDARDLVRLNIYQHLRRSSAKRRQFDGIIVDAPPYSPHKDRTPGARGVFAIAAMARPMLRPDGWMMCFFHHIREPRSVIEDRLLASTGHDMRIAWRGQSGEDFPEEREEERTRMTVLVAP